MGNQVDSHCWVIYDVSEKGLKPLNKFAQLSTSIDFEESELELT